jgi:hypothetical protein
VPAGLVTQEHRRPGAAVGPAVAPGQQGEQCDDQFLALGCQQVVVPGRAGLTTRMRTATMTGLR